MWFHLVLKDCFFHDLRVKNLAVSRDFEIHAVSTGHEKCEYINKYEMLFVLYTKGVTPAYETMISLNTM